MCAPPSPQKQQVSPLLQPRSWWQLHTHLCRPPLTCVALVRPSRPSGMQYAGWLTQQVCVCVRKSWLLLRMLQACRGSSPHSQYLTTTSQTPISDYGLCPAQACMSTGTLWATASAGSFMPRLLCATTATYGRAACSPGRRLRSSPSWRWGPGGKSRGGWTAQAGRR